MMTKPIRALELHYAMIQFSLISVSVREGFMLIRCHSFMVQGGVYVVVQFYPWFKFYFPLFIGIVMYDNDFKSKGNKI